MKHKITILIFATIMATSALASEVYDPILDILESPLSEQMLIITRNMNPDGTMDGSNEEVISIVDGKLSITIGGVRAKKIYDQIKGEVTRIGPDLTTKDAAVYGIHCVQGIGYNSCTIKK
jgi:hypothetical protein